MLFSARGASAFYPVVVLTRLTLMRSALKTPQLLELSGIGDKSILQSLGIQTVLDLPGVGANLQDHVVCPLSFGKC